MHEIAISAFAIIGLCVIGYLFIVNEMKNRRREKNRPDFERVFNSLEYATPEKVQQTMQAIKRGEVKGVSNAHINTAVQAAENLGFKVE